MGRTAGYFGKRCSSLNTHDVAVVKGEHSMTTTMDISEAKQHLNELLDLAKKGHEVCISEGNTPVARLTLVAPVSGTRKPRVAGLHLGAISVGDDFDRELPEEFWTGIE